MKKIAYIASECVPFIKTGGLADVVGTLPKAGRPSNAAVLTGRSLYKVFLQCAFFFFQQRGIAFLDAAAGYGGKNKAFFCYSLLLKRLMGIGRGCVIGKKSKNGRARAAHARPQRTVVKQTAAGFGNHRRLPARQRSFENIEHTAGNTFDILGFKRGDHSIGIGAHLHLQLVHCGKKFGGG